MSTFNTIEELRQIFYEHAQIGNWFLSAQTKNVTDKHRDALNYEMLMELLAEVDTTRDKFKALTQRKKDLNL